MATDTEQSFVSRTSFKTVLALAAYSVVLYVSSSVSLILFSVFDAGELAVRESLAVMVALSPLLVAAAVAVTGTHYVLERGVGIFAG